MRRTCSLLAALLATFTAARAEDPPPTPPPPPAAAPADETSAVRKEIDKIKEALATLTGGVQFSGFFDVQASSYKKNANVFEMGLFEFDIARSIGRNFQVGAAFVLDRDSSALTVGFIDFHLFGGLIPPRGRLYAERGFHVQVGQFDVPFGNDWQFFAPRDRVAISAPLSTELTMNGGYNDVGLRVIGSDAAVNYAFYMLRGIGDGNAYGGRIGFTPFGDPWSFKSARPRKALEVGASYLYDVTRDGRLEERIAAADAESQLGPVHLCGEWVQRDTRPSATLPDGKMQRGWHVTVEWAVPTPAEAPLTLFARYDRHRAGGDHHEHRVTAGGSLGLYDVAILKLEWLHTLAESAARRTDEAYVSDAYTAQLVIWF